jgi:hypothetical protein
MASGWAEASRIPRRLSPARGTRLSIRKQHTVHGQRRIQQPRRLGWRSRSASSASRLNGSPRLAD